MSSVWVQGWDVVGSKGDVYRVSQKADGSYGCACAGWKFKKAPKPDCKHIRAIRQALTCTPRPVGDYNLIEEAKIAVRTSQGMKPVSQKPKPIERVRLSSPTVQPTEVYPEVQINGDRFTITRKFKFAE